MQANDIRDRYNPDQLRENSSEVQAFALVEIAAQLATINEFLRSIYNKDNQALDVVVLRNG